MIAIFHTGVANSASVQFSLERLGCRPILSADPDMLAKASKVILPGVGTANALMNRIQEKELKQAILNLKVPVLGICLGMQALFTYSEEGQVDCLKVISGNVTKLDTQGKLPVPHMGWNKVTFEKPSMLFQNIPNDSFFYFVHSYRVDKGIPEAIARTEYGESFTSAVEKEHWFGVQFHPERSGKMGEVLLQNFLNL